MKVSKDKKNEIRKKLIASCVDTVTEKGFQSATMREIANRAGIASATIYNYFPTKESLFFAYFTDRQADLAASLQQIPEFKDFNLKEKLQAQMMTLLDLYLPDREFVEQAYHVVFASPFSAFNGFGPVRDSFSGASDEIIRSAIESGEIPDHPVRGFISRAYTDFTGMVIMYWLKDDSEGFSRTSQVIDLALDVFIEVLKSGLIVKFTDLLVFLFRSHLSGGFQRLAGIVSAGNSAARFFTGSFAGASAGSNEKGQR